MSTLSPHQDGDARPRASSDSLTPRQSPAPGTTTPNLRLLSASTTNLVTSPSASSVDPSLPPGVSSRTLGGILTDKLQSLAGHHIKPNPQVHPALLLHPHSISRARSSEPGFSPTLSSFPPLPLMGATSKGAASPSKATYGRAYESKLVTREMHRLAPSVSSLTLPAPGTMTQATMNSTSTNDPWGTLHVHILPLFNGEPLRIPIEDLNVLVRRHITTAASSPSKALATLENDAGELINSGMRTLNAKLADKEDDKLIGRVVEIWGFFWDQVLPYVEGALLPLQTDPLLSSLARQPKRGASPTRQPTKGSISGMSSLSTPQIDVRTVALRSFRDKVILPLAPRLKARLSMANRQDNFPETSGYQQPRLQQMLLVLTSQNRYRSPTFSLTAASQTAPSNGEAAVLELLRLLRSPAPQIPSAKAITGRVAPRAPSFLSGGLPRDRRGRIAHKQKLPDRPPEPEQEELSGGETPRLGSMPPLNLDRDAQRELERETQRDFLESLKSPGFAPSTRQSIGGWGLGPGQDESGSKEDVAEDEPLDWDQAQAVVERMVGMQSDASLSRRRNAVA
ncbi:HbrB-domain-containing protein [Cylindrobasidium torrendii FP15055 ss-10]|uniref:HbrB-domain-containing protein n=1 Tax=Cylindrobasidium torrendii FP15055 ss-10 TaxID=1314674 RepID=A0A0D7BTF9_9AGAR|nr:HbrB-domain-containing protein [Cylindrobasidium torrendii FP15055 ss-10]